VLKFAAAGAAAAVVSPSELCYWRASHSTGLIVLLPTLGFSVVAFVIGRAWALLVPAIAWPLYFLGLRERWWGNGLGDRWQYALGGMTLLGLAAAAAGLMLRALVFSADSRRRRAAGHRS
jgi:hypothetical protein